MLMFIVTVLLLITTTSAKGPPVNSTQHIGTVATYGEDTFTIWNGDLYCGYEKAEIGEITWVICQEDVLFWSKLDGDEADIYYKHLPFGDKAVLYHAPSQVESFDIVNNELYYLYDGSIIQVNLNSDETLLVASKDFAEGFYITPDKSLRYVEKTYVDLFPDLQEDYSGYQELWFPDFRGENATLFAGGTVSADFISNSNKRQYIENAISYYLATYSSLTETLGNNKPVVFFFEGGSDNCDASGYNWSVKRTGATCVVIRYQQGTETPYIAYHSENCSTIPDYPLGYGQYSSNGGMGSNYGTATLMDGIYNLVAVNHKGDYASYQVQQNGSAYVPAIYMKNDGSYSHHNASGINTHTRTMRNVSSAPSAPWSAGCFLIGSSTPFNEYNGYVEAINNGKSNIFTTTYRGYSIDKFSNTGYYAGKIVVDRYLATDALIGIYGNRNAVTDLTTFSSDNKTPAPTPIPDPPIIDVGSNYKVGDTVTITWNPVENGVSQKEGKIANKA
ncbi:MAG: hypothetical protein IJT04_07215, partial [Bacteroidales bacterium]|nr:hypothetical protein [Bacteroidales bacterium]